MTTSNDTGASRSPDVSVVVPSVNRVSMLLETLSALDRQEGGVELEVLVPERTGPETRERVRAEHPGVVVIPVAPDTPIPTMRRLAFDRATSPVVAVLEDHISVPSDWALRVRDAVTEDRPVVGGWVRNAATERLVDRAAFMCEYGHMLVKQPSGSAEWLTGNNVAYHRSVLDRFRDVIDQDRWENHLHDAIRETGITLRRISEIEVGHKMHYSSALEYAGQRFLYSRAYAGMRLADAGRLRSLFYGVAALALPPVLLLRIVKSGWGAPEVRRDLGKSLPILTLFAAAWGLGEVVGAWAGPGDALGRVR